MNAVEIRSVTKTFGTVTAVDNLMLNVPTGCVYGFIGPNGVTANLGGSRDTAPASQDFPAYCQNTTLVSRHLAAENPRRQ